MQTELLDKSQENKKTEKCVCRETICKCGIALLCFMIGGSFSFVVGYRYFCDSIDASESGDVLF